ncbi:MAG TPA: PilN domain-containing protein [Gaiellaceae bacterium]|nr:PilN domain-containing protein [Gaiellaceae bacterium]
MRAVNLLPRELEQGRKGPAKPVIFGCAGAVLATAVLAVGYLNASSKVGDENKQLASVQAQIAALPQPQAPPATVSAIPAERQARVAALTSALAQRVPWDRVLREVSLVLPDDVWLTSLQASAPQPAPAGAAPVSATNASGFTMVGSTYSQAAVARLLARLSVVPDLENVSLSTSAQTLIGNRNVVTFTIVAGIRPPGATS